MEKTMALTMMMLLTAWGCDKDRPGPRDPEPTPVPAPTPSPYSTRTIDRFLWKPEGEHTGKIVILVDKEDVQGVIVSSKGSERLDPPYRGDVDWAGSIMRGNQPGCWYGKNIKVEFLDKQQGEKLMKTALGAEFKGVADGCKRQER
jgi:hypothetical protein